MHLLRVKHNDFVLTFECTKFQQRWEKGIKLLKGAHHLTLLIRVPMKQR